ncbi:MULTISPECIES: NYN domain-containing protein [unclassified Arsukibacterium]|uniref:NYN domain-containing protein n=1 Tax=unclassified Arsukibacterium TaxID=2635278 RepID=UPI000C6340E7|nr:MULTISPECIES: NYN domain-containing protein [unclassified Arsukibacterium]MAA95245.1 nuclease [Rheinheimera sp.]MBM35020.1 nuclease [Rheinheimera sp.]HAW92420.1 nuclease [Candidatus Azambacteria bacterium]|tara:strand:- start:12849 stop:13325 length:477 start_codon:yes stop_codon:yes gene_type:complete
MNSVTILVDVQNIYYTSRQAFGKSFDYNAFWAEVTTGRKVDKAIAYAIDRGDEKQRQFQNILRAIGFEVKLKPFIQRADGSAKGDWDVGITLDAIEFGQHSDVLVLASGDGDFALLAERLISRYQTEVEVYGVPSLTAQGLVNAASRFVAVGPQLLLG